MTKYLSHVFYVYSEASGAVFFLFGAGLELACGFALGFDHPVAILAWFAAVAFAVIAMLQVWYIVRSESRYNRYTSGC